uniref:Transposase n=1 Tax=Syphacia muris TaxID=451379 RepID=A0A0N5A9J6_9BILA
MFIHHLFLDLSFRQIRNSLISSVYDKKSLNKQKPHAVSIILRANLSMKWFEPTEAHSKKYGLPQLGKEHSRMQ